MLTSNDYLLGRTVTDVIERLKTFARKLHKQINARARLYTRLFAERLPAA
ncbi:MAG: hypothetical protein RLN89_00320 [Parvibaculum sp.]